MPPEIKTETKKRIIETLKYMKKEAPCTTIANIARKFNLTWTQARHIINLLIKAGVVTEIRIAKKVLWCLDDNAATSEIYKLIHHAWRVICKSNRKYIRPSMVAQLIAQDPRARKAYLRYVDITRASPSTLKVMNIILTELLKKPIEKKPRKVIFYVPPEFCQKEPRLEDLSIRRYKPQRRIVSFKVPPAMYNDMIKAAQQLGISIPELVRMAIKRLISQYKQTPTDNKDADLKANTDTLSRITIAIPNTMHKDMLEAIEQLGISQSELVRIAIERLISQYKQTLTDNKDADLKANIGAQ